MIICSQPECQTSAGCKCAVLPHVGQNAMIDLIRENERMKVALKAISVYAANEKFDVSVRHDIIAFIKQILAA